MELPKLTRNQWIAVGVLVLIAVILSMTFTRWWNGEAIEVSVENAGTKPVFVYIDNTGRHGSSTPVEKLQTTDGKQTPSGRNRSLSGVLCPPAPTRNNPSHIHQGGAGSDQGDSDQQQVAAA